MMFTSSTAAQSAGSSEAVAATEVALGPTEHLA